MSTQNTPVNRKQKARFRPPLSDKHLEHLILLCKRDLVATEEQESFDLSAELVAKLCAFKAKIDNKGIAAAYTLAPDKPTMIEELGGLKDFTSPTKVSKEEYWELCYTKFLNDSIQCSLNELQAAKEHMYLNDLMSPEEVTEYEK